MADIEAADAPGEVDERVPIDVRQRRTLAPPDHDGQIDGERIRDHAVLPVEDFLRAGAGDGRSELDCLRCRHQSDDSAASGRPAYLYKGLTVA